MSIAPKLEVFPADPARGFIGLIALVLMAGGAGAIWGPAAFFLSLGTVLTFICVLDETIERITHTRRDKGTDAAVVDDEKRI